MVSRNVLYFSIPFVAGLVLLILGFILGFVVFPNILEASIEQNVVLKEGTLQWYRFKEIPFPINFKVHFFTIENPVAVINGAKPIVVEKGPYVYSEMRQKINTSVRGDEIVYSDLWSFQFNEEASAPLKEDDEITVINAPLLAVMQNLEEIPIALPATSEQIFSDIFQDPQIFINVKIGEYGFRGIKMCDPTRSTVWSSKLVCLAMMLMNLKLIKYNQDLSMDFSLFDYKTKADGPFTINAGTKNLDNLGLITSYKGEDYTKFWNGQKTSCDKVEGRYTTFPPFMEKDESWSVYSTDICKSASLFYTDTTTFKDVEGYRFKMNRDSVVSAEQKDTCICVNRTKGLDGKEHCFSDGVVDLQNCIGAPVILSFPHLMWANEEYSNNIEGLNSNITDPDQYTTILDFQPHLGIPLRGALRIQFNVVLRPIIYGSDVIEVTKDIAPTLFPIIWLEESFELTDELIEELETDLLNNLVLMDIVTWVLVGVACFVLVLTLGFCIYRSFFKKDNQMNV